MFDFTGAYSLCDGQRLNLVSTANPLGPRLPSHQSYSGQALCPFATGRRKFPESWDLESLGLLEAGVNALSGLLYKHCPAVTWMDLLMSDRREGSTPARFSPTDV